MTALVLALGLAGCSGANSRGQDLIVHYGCGSCHRISGIDQADGRVGPSLIDYGSTRYIAGGRLANTARNTVRWIMHPQRYLKGTLMPELGVTEDEARAMTAYLYAH